MKLSSYDESLARFTDITGHDARAKPHVTSRPRYDDEDPGPSLFRTLLADCSLERMTLPGLFVGRSELSRVSFTASDLHLSTFCWNDLTQCWFDRCDLADSDLRSSNFNRCDFSHANLTRCDLRHSSFEECRFDGAVLAGAVASEDQRGPLGLSDEQSGAVSWKTPGPQPDGG
jgi:uncharacterized protein YjbI with pentapeptide repeats